jgi:hypothetical protein
MKNLTKALSAVLLTVAAVSASAAPIYVGAWNLYSGENWGSHTAPILTGQMAAAELFGGAADDYVISTNGDSVANINYLAWYDQYGLGLDQFAQDYLSDSGQIGVYDTMGDTSAMIMDNGRNSGAMNYAFRVDAPADVPEPLTVGLIGAGMLGMAMARRRKFAK